jgi:two-component system sensor histidine kinase MprB
VNTQARPERPATRGPDPSDPPTDEIPVQSAPLPMRAPIPLTRSVSLRGRVTAMAAIVVGVAVAFMSAAAYLVVQSALYTEVDTQLEGRAATLLNNSNALQVADARTALALSSLFSSDLRVAVTTPKGLVSVQDQAPPIGDAELAVTRGTSPMSLRTVDDFRVLAQHAGDGTTVVLAQSLAPTRQVLNRLGVVLLLVGAGGILLAAAAGTAVGRAGLRPVARLTAAAERVAATEDLTPITVTGDDELARLTQSFNRMLRAVGESRERQRRLVADAGHELRTPLTSLRTNMELLAAANRPGAPALGETDRAELLSDVGAQIEELSTLVGDLVELAREDAPVAAQEPLELGELVGRALDRARRRRSEIEFVAELQPWTVLGDSAGLERAVLNVLDNAAKWSPAGEQVQVQLRQVDAAHAELTVADAGAGIGEADRALVFERFYRATSSRSMPGSGLGLAIVKQVVAKHGGAVRAEVSDRGGALIRLRLPGTTA